MTGPGIELRSPANTLTARPMSGALSLSLSIYIYIYIYIILVYYVWFLMAYQLLWVI